MSVSTAAESRMRAQKWRAVCGRGAGLLGLAKARRRKTKVEVMLGRKERPVASRIHAALLGVRARVLATLVAAYERHLASTEKAGGVYDRIIEEILDQIDARGVAVAVVDSLGDELRAVFRQAGLTGVAEVGFDASAAIVSQVDVSATAYAAARGAELVTAISDSTRNELRTLVSEAVEEGWSVDTFSDAIVDSTSFSDARATMIARTELAFAHVQGNLDGWRVSDEVESKVWLASAGACPICQALDGTEVGLGEMFDYDGEAIDGPPGHPNCRCDVLPVLKEKEKDDD